MRELTSNKEQDGNDQGNEKSETSTNYINSLENIANNQTHGDNSRATANTAENVLDLKMDKNKVMCKDPLVVGTSTNKPGEDAEVRDTWANKVEFILACIGNVVGLGNMWRFPYLCYKSGGGAFLIPYFIMLVVCGIPLLYMELAVGQYTRQGPIGAMHKICPLFKGTGLATVIMSFLLSTYYNVIIAWALYYLINSFMDPLPWEGCNNDWNSELCWNGTKFNSSQDQEENNKTSAPQEFYDNHLLQMTKGIENFGTMRWELLGCLAVAWILVYFCLWKGIKSSGKVVYVTATLPYLFIGAFIVRALTLPGSELGLVYFFSPKWETLLEAKVWVNAAAQNFNSIGIAFGSLMAFSSYNRFDNRLMRDTLIISLTDAITCILAGICVFGTLGNLAFEQGKSVDEVVSSGPGLVFVAYPAALSKMPFPQVWSVIFFSMLLCLGIDSQFATVEVIITSIKDAYGRWIRLHLKRHEVLVLLVCFVSFICGLPNVMQGGIYFFTLIDYYAAAISLMYIAFFEVIAIVWVYGANRLARNVRDMTGELPNYYIRGCWMVAAPCLIMAIWIFSLADYEAPTYNKGQYIFPGWSIGMGWAISCLSLLAIPILAVVAIVKAKGNNITQKLKASIKSPIRECPCCGKMLNKQHEAHHGTAANNPDNEICLEQLTSD
ncbi:hypothetical protein GHT06_011364 [Daphnia sinensis]|uniref:Transporter n=1 Tax=Daphnia sinensis TaxID=1820382 RepID=A0AAD5PXR2_9CRUS|nr:hypothetical protein GHT06_011364 [Daphnia sinensis]